MDDKMQAVLVDSSWLLARSWHLHIKEFTEEGKFSVDGKYTGDLYEYTMGILRVRRAFPNAIIFLCIDSKDEDGNYEKMDTASDYKKGRGGTGMFDNYHESLLLSCAVNNTYVLASPRREADEVIVSFARQLHEQGKRVCSFVKDKDMFQALNHLEYLFTKFSRGMPKDKVTKESLKESWGVNPEAAALFQAIIGDGVDNVESFSRFQRKPAAEICNTYPTPALLEARDMENCQMSPKAKRWVQKLHDGHEKLAKNYKLTNMDTVKYEDLVLYKIGEFDDAVNLAHGLRLNQFLTFLDEQVRSS